MYVSSATEEEIIHSLASPQAASNWSQSGGSVRRELQRVQKS